MHAHPEICFKGNTPGIPWNMIAAQVVQLRGDVGGQAAVSGPDFFELTSPEICSLIQRMDGADKCANYVMKQFELVPRRPAAKEKKEEAPALPIPIIPRDENGKPIFPIHLFNGFCVMDLGHIVTDRPAFHTEQFIFPAGFKSSRTYFSVLNASKKVRYTSEILDTGDEAPLFRVTMEDRPEISFEGPNPTLPWTYLIRRILELRGDASGRFTALTGAQYYGLQFPAVCYLIQEMDGADKCGNYVMTRFVSPAVIEKHRHIAAADPPGKNKDG
jgi:chromodomain-helicase-DNA-binding protein 7